MILLVLLGCAVERDTTPPVPDYAVPAILSLVVECDADDAEWTVEADCDAWTGNGEVLLSKDGSYVERHPFLSVEAAADGTADTLRVRLGVVADWRTVDAGSTTAFNCGEPGVTGEARVNERTGETIADCWRFGDDPARWETWEPDVPCSDITGT